MIYQGDCLDVLKTLPENSVHCVVTSPPYWSLRDYKVPPTVWGGRSACAHQWVTAGSREGYSAKKKWQHSMTNAPAENGRGEEQDSKRSRLRSDNPEGWTQIEQGKFCADCQAWLRVAKQIHITERATYDASSTPTQSAKAIRPKVLAPADRK